MHPNGPRVCRRRLRSRLSPPAAGDGQHNRDNRKQETQKARKRYFIFRPCHLFRVFFISIVLSAGNAPRRTLKIPHAAHVVG